MHPASLAMAAPFAARIAFVGTSDTGTIVVDALTERGPMALRTTHRPGAPGWSEWTTLALMALRRWADEGSEVACRIVSDPTGRRADLDDGVRRLRLDLDAPRRASLPGSLTCASRPAADHGGMGAPRGRMLRRRSRRHPA
jgi:hypothetical protein